MELRDLNADERLALAALVEFVVMASGHATEEEKQEIDAIVEALGEDVYRQAVEEVDKRFARRGRGQGRSCEDDRQEAREVIYGTVMEAAMTDTVEGRESQLLTWLAKEWNVEVKYEEPPADDAKA